MSPAPHPRYLLAFTAMTMLVVGLVAAVNYLVDPYFMNGTYRQTGVNQIKPALARKTYLHVAWRLQSVRADTMVLGTSRAEIGIDPSGPGFQGSTAFNAAIGGASLYATWRYFEHALATHRPKRVLLGLDFFAFNEVGQKDRVPEGIMLRGAPSMLDRARLGVKALETYVAWGSLLDSLTTLRSQAWQKGGLKNDRGLMTPPHSTRGLYVNFRNNLAAFMEGIWFPGRDREFILARPTEAGPIAAAPGPDGPGNAFDCLNAILAAAARENIDVRMFISPHHAYLLEALRAVGLWDEYEAWKRQLTTLAAKWPGAVLWDFSGYNRFTTEPVPAPSDDKARMLWHLEASHYSPALGDLVVSKVYGVPAPAVDLSDFGVRLRPDTVEDHLAATRTARAAYVATNGPRIEKILAEAHHAKKYRTPDAPEAGGPIQ